jgi:TPP-dependent pyruvate/acetoin dehydrogenase alpha subunit
MSDPGKYRTKEEVEEMMRHDPILRFAKLLAEQHRVAQAELEAIDKDVLAQVDESVRFAEQSPWPTAEELYQDVYVRSPYIHQKAADKDPAWRAAESGDRVPEHFPAWAQAAAPAKVEG